MRSVRDLRNVVVCLFSCLPVQAYTPECEIVLHQNIDTFSMTHRARRYRRR